MTKSTDQRVRCGNIEIVQRAELVLLVHHGKRNKVIEVEIDPRSLERWAVRKIRQEVLS